MRISGTISSDITRTIRLFAVQPDYVYLRRKPVIRKTALQTPAVAAGESPLSGRSAHGRAPRRRRPRESDQAVVITRELVAPVASGVSQHLQISGRRPDGRLGPHLAASDLNCEGLFAEKRSQIGAGGKSPVTPNGRGAASSRELIP